MEEQNIFGNNSTGRSPLFVSNASLNNVYSQDSTGGAEYSECEQLPSKKSKSWISLRGLMSLTKKGFGSSGSRLLEQQGYDDEVILFKQSKRKKDQAHLSD